MKIDTSGWKEFKLNQIFKITTGACVNRQELKKGEIPRISVKGINNGIQGYFKSINSNNYREEENFISFSFLGTCFYHPYKASLDMKVHCLKPLNYTLNKHIGLFLVNVFKNSYSGTFNNQISSTDLKNESIFLPVDKSGNPDWEYMENTIKSTEKEIIDIIKRHELRIRYISSIRWKKFKLKDLFEVCSSKKIFHANTIENIYDFEKEGTYPYVVRSAVNNGIRGYIKENENYLNPANTLSFAQDTFSVFYQEKPYFTGNKIKVLIPKFKGLNKINALFIVANFKKLLVDFTWGKSSTTNSIKEISIKLPVKDYIPDFELIENLMKYIGNENGSLLNIISKN